MNKKFKFLTVLLALVMTLGAFAPFSARAEEATETESVTIHKILLTKAALDAHDKDKKYDGNAIKDIKDFFGDQKAEEIDGVYFRLEKLNDGITEEKINVNDDKQWTPVTEGENAKEPFKYKGLTKDKKGLKLDTKGLKKGTYRIVEDLEKSTYKGKDGELLAASKAVPTLLNLPIVNEKEGIVKEAHVYPKNTQEKPKVDKDFKEGNKLRPSNKDADKDEIDEIHGGANVDNNQRDKKRATADLGENIPYEIKTVIPAKTKYKTLAWDDTMSKGLTFNDDIKLQIGGKDATLGEDYIVSYKENGFTIQLLQAGLDKVYDKDAETEIYITYSATVNGEAEVDKSEKNKLKFYYDNNISVNGKPEPTNPVDGKLKVTKDFPNVTGDWVEGEEVIVTIIDVETGKPVKFKDGQQATVVLTKDKQTHEWTGLDNNKQYKVVETFKPSDIVTYEKSENGEVIIHDQIKPEKPNEIEPSVPEVILGGRKFVKTNNEEKGSDKLERLPGAEFYVKNADGKYLVAAKKDAKAVTDAKAALDEAVKAYNELSAEEQKGEKGTTAKNTINQKQKDYNDAFVANATEYTWGEKTDANVVVLTSDAEGRFEIKGLAYAEGYKLEEKTAPKGFAKLQSDEKFNVYDGSYASTDAELQYNKDNTKAGYGLQIKNKNVTIPQTGGIGTVIFTVVGVMLMVGAAFALKRRKEDELEGLA